MEKNEDRWKYSKVDIDLIDEAELNANEMTGEDYSQLVDNINKSGLCSLPTCYRKPDGRFVMIGGHHRLRACKKLHYKQIGIVWCDQSELTEDEIIAIQLSLNSLHGEDNKSILKKMFSLIKSVDYKKFAHINIDEIKPVSTDGISVFAMKENFVFTIVLYPNSFLNVDELYGDIREQAKKCDALLLAHQEDNEMHLLKLQQDIGQQFKIKSPAVSFAKLLELANERLNQIKEEES